MDFLVFAVPGIAKGLTKRSDPTGILTRRFRVVPVMFRDFASVKNYENCSKTKLLNMIQHQRVVDVKINRLAVREYCRKTGDYSLGALDYLLTAKERQECFDSQEKGCQSWYESDSQSLRQVQAETEEYHRHVDRAVEQLQAAESFWGSFETTVKALESEVKVMSARTEDRALTSALNGMPQQPRKRGTRGRGRFFKSSTTTH